MMKVLRRDRNFLRNIIPEKYHRRSDALNVLSGNFSSLDVLLLSSKREEDDVSNAFHEHSYSVSVTWTILWETRRVYITETEASYNCKVNNWSTGIELFAFDSSLEYCIGFSCSLSSPWNGVILSCVVAFAHFELTDRKRREETWRRNNDHFYLSSSLSCIIVVTKQQQEETLPKSFDQNR